MTIDNKENAPQEPIRIIVTGPSASGKTAIVGLIAELLERTAGFTDIVITNPEETLSGIREKMSALVSGEMNAVFDVCSRAVEISETGPLTYGLEQDFRGHERATGIAYHVWAGEDAGKMVSSREAMDAAQGVAEKIDSVDSATNNFDNNVNICNQWAIRQEHLDNYDVKK